MFQRELKQAVADKDWESAKQIQELQDKRLERVIKYQEMRSKIRKEEAERIKILAEAEKISRDSKYNSALIAAVVGAIISLGTFIKSLFN